MKSGLDVQSTFLAIWRSTTAGRRPYGALERRRPETTASASQLEAHIHAPQAEQFPEYHDMVEQSADSR
jgi:hypothetical protein